MLLKILQIRCFKNVECKLFAKYIYIYICTWRSSIFRNISITLKIIHHKEAPFKRKNYLLWKVCYFLLTSRVVKFIIICYSRVAFARRGTVFGEPLTTGIYAQTWNPPRSWYTPGTSSCRDHLLQLRRYLTDLIYCLTDSLNETILPRELRNKPRVITPTNYYPSFQLGSCLLWRTTILFDHSQLIKNVLRDKINKKKRGKKQARK